ncbi:unnamed protein product [Effrenium voratum]|uniref:Uncharacterized protein n=1 Tax=Effrenium voratum TaxID=2562239 RepID=A0AA36I654_9DINO|nr:unnamed protein product [Effrenium voratum]CAJ1381823.1 unnamed protein product [Effrenium voratum]CAJ1433395.1 unnamed protein product [Effrenium voratum]
MARTPAPLPRAGRQLEEKTGAVLLLSILDCLSSTAQSMRAWIGWRSYRRSPRGLQSYETPSVVLAGIAQGLASHARGAVSWDTTRTMCFQAGWVIVFTGLL